MAETGEIVAGATALGGFLGGAVAALKFWKHKPEGSGAPEKDAGMSDVLQRVARLEQRAEESEKRDNEASLRDDAIFARLNSLDRKTSAVLAILDERRTKQ